MNNEDDVIVTSLPRHIHQYRQQVLADEQRELSVAEAAQEWIARYAADFPAWDELSQEDKH